MFIGTRLQVIPETKPAVRAKPTRQASGRDIARPNVAMGNQAMLRVQAKLMVGAIDGPLEREADRVADRVMHMAAPYGCGCSGNPTRTSRPGNRSLHRSTDPGAGIEADDAIVSRLGAGRPLEPDLRDFFEPRLGADFGAVRVHTGTDSDAAARSVNARAFTLGRDIVFRTDQYEPRTDTGRRLLAHELAHVVQQGEGTGRVCQNATCPARASSETVRDVSAGRPAVQERAAAGMLQADRDKLEPDSHNLGLVHGASVSGNEVVVDMFPMAYMLRAELMEKESEAWNRASRIFHVHVSVLGRLRPWVPHPHANENARSMRTVVVITARSRFDNRTLSITIGGRTAPQPHPPPQPPSLLPLPGADRHDRAPRQAVGAASSDRVGQVERESASDPKGALRDASELTGPELRALGPGPRKSLLQAKADEPGSGAPQLATDLVTTTSDRDAGTVSDALHADGGKLLDDLKRNARDSEERSRLDAAARDLEARRLNLPPAREKDYVDSTPELAKKAEEVRQALQKFGLRTPGLDEDQAADPNWNRLRTLQDQDLQRELRNLDREVASLDKELAAERPGDVGLGYAVSAVARDEVGKALERVRAARTVRELFEARKAAKAALWRANQAMDAKRGLKRLQDYVAGWNKAQGGFAALASAPSHLLAGVSADRPDQIAAEARAAVERGLAQLRDAKTPEEMSRAATLLKQKLADAGWAFSEHQDEVARGAHHAEIGIEATAGVAIAVVAPEVVLPGMLVGGGIPAARQGVQLAEGARMDFKGEEVFHGAVAGGFVAPLVAAAPWLGYAFAATGVYSGAKEIGAHHGWTGAFDIGASVALPFAIKGVPRFNQWARPRAMALGMRVFNELPEGLAGRAVEVANLPIRPSVVAVAEGGRPITLGTSKPAESVMLPPTGSGRTPGSSEAWQTWQLNRPTPQPYDIPFTFNPTAPTPAPVRPRIFALKLPGHTASWQVGTAADTPRTRAEPAGSIRLSASMAGVGSGGRAPPPVPAMTPGQVELETWIAGTLGSGMGVRPPPLPRPGAQPLAVGETRYELRTILEALRVYDEFRARAPGREIGLYRNRWSGEFAVVAGQEGSVREPWRGEPGAWDAIIHNHPNPFSALTFRNPAPQDLYNQARGTAGGGRATTTFIEADLPGGGRSYTAVTMALDGSVAVLYRGPSRTLQRQSFRSVEEFTKDWSARTIYVEHGSSSYRDMIHGLNDFYAAPHSDAYTTSGPGRLPPRAAMPPPAPLLGSEEEQAVKVLSIPGPPARPGAAARFGRITEEEGVQASGSFQQGRVIVGSQRLSAGHVEAAAGSRERQTSSHVARVLFHLAPEAVEVQVGMAPKGDTLIVGVNTPVAARTLGSRLAQPDSARELLIASLAAADASVRSAARKLIGRQGRAVGQQGRLDEVNTDIEHSLRVADLFERGQFTIVYQEGNVHAERAMAVFAGTIGDLGAFRPAGTKLQCAICSLAVPPETVMVAGRRVPVVGRFLVGQLRHASDEQVRELIRAIANKEVLMAESAQRPRALSSMPPPLELGERK